MPQPTGPGRATMAQVWECTEWLNHEAELLDDNRLHEWLELLTPDIDYRLPIRVTRERAKGAGFSEDGYHMYEDYDSLSVRVQRLDGEYAWAEDPPTRTRRIVGNVRVTPTADGVFSVRSNLLIYRSRFAGTDYELLAGERHDQLVDTESGLRLCRRLILLDHTTLANKNLAVFF